MTINKTQYSAWVQKWINQIAHVFAASYLVLALARHTPTVYIYLGPHRTLSFSWEAVLAVLVFSAVKEFVIDPLTETVVEAGSDAEDFGFWLLGIALGIVSAL